METLLGNADFVKKQWNDLSDIVDSALSEISGKVEKLQKDVERLKTRVDNWSGYLENKNTQPVVKRGRGRPRKVRV